jgi:hypothetical protein
MKLTIDNAQKIAGAFQRLQEIGSGAIIQPGNEAESKALKKFLSDQMTEYAQDFLTCFFIVATEYEPLVTGVAGLLRRGGAIAARINQQQNEPGTPAAS